jgi:hypothetical protein
MEAGADSVLFRDVIGEFAECLRRRDTDRNRPRRARKPAFAEAVAALILTTDSAPAAIMSQKHAEFVGSSGQLERRLSGVI